MASFAIDGGLLIYGVDEATTPLTVKPVLLHGLPERLEQIELTRVSPPLHVRPVALPDPAGTTHGVVVVVPANGSAPSLQPVLRP
jgi:hypothetical protein